MIFIFFASLVCVTHSIHQQILAPISNKSLISKSYHENWHHGGLSATPIDELTSYWDNKWCGPFAGKDDKVIDHNQWMCYGINNRKHKTCRPEIAVSTDICPSGLAVLDFYEGDGSMDSYTDSNGCKYWFYAEYLCKPFEDLVSYWDLHHCGPFAGKDDKVVDHNQWMCYGIKNRRHKTCRDEVDMSTTVCPSGKAHLDFYKGDGSRGSYVDDNGCEYWFYAEYKCGPKSS